MTLRKLENDLGWKRGEVDIYIYINGGFVGILDRVKYCFNGDLTHLFQAKIKYILMDNFNLQNLANSVFLPRADVLTLCFY